MSPKAHKFKFKLLHKQQTTYYRKPIECELELELELELEGALT